MRLRRTRAGVDNNHAQEHKADSYGGYEEPAPVVDPFGRSPRRLVGVSVARAVLVQQCGLTLPARPVHTRASGAGTPPVMLDAKEVEVFAEPAGPARATRAERARPGTSGRSTG